VTTIVATREASVLLDAPVRRVTLLEDRAQVTREGAVTLAAGSHRLRVEGVAPVTVDKSLAARCASPGLRVDEARVVRRWASPGANARDPRELEAEQRRLREERERMQERRRLAERRRGLSREAASLVLDGVSRDLPFATAFEPRWETEAGRLLGALRDRNEEILGLDRELEDLALRERAVDAGALAGSTGGALLETAIVLDITVKDPGEYRIALDYMVPCALWRPIHRATLDAGSILFECEAAVWQATGEDWRDVALSFSTARPTQRAEPPVLTDDVLSVRRRVEKKVEVTLREEAIATTGEGQARRGGELPGVDDGGETRLLGAPVAATVRSSGRLSRVPVFSFEAPAEVDRLSCPERSPLVHWRSRQANAARHPILAGPVELLRQSGYVGRGQIGFVAPGERFVLGWGPDDSLRVRRTAGEQRERATLSGKQTITRTVELSISNLDSLAADFRLEERVPVSEIEKVTVEVDSERTRPKAVLDQQGIVAWKIQVPARGTQSVHLAYRIVASSDIQGL
jgi:uncharacterized protein (TIGR02231 family)